MNREHLTLAVVALACFSAVGTSATTLSSSVGTDPDEAVDPDYDALPVEREDAVEAQRLIAEDRGDGDAAVPTGTPAGRAGSAPEEGADGSTQGTVDADSGDPNVGAADRDATPTAAGADSGDSTASGSSFTDGLQGTLGLLGEAVESLLATLLWVLFAAAVAALAAHYRDVLGPDDRPATDGGPRHGRRVTVTEPASDENAVYAAWDALVRDLDLPDAESATAAECADRATEQGYDPAAVRDLRRAFEAVRYGDRPVTEARREAVQAACERLDIGGGGDGR